MARLPTVGSVAENRRPGLVLAAVVFVLGWLLAAALNYFILSVSFVTPVPVGVLRTAAWLTAAVATAVSAWLAWRRLSRPGLAGFAAVTVAAAVLMASVNWVHFYATSWYAMHRPDYAEVLRYVDHLPPGEGPPRGISRLDGDAGAPVWFIRARSGIPGCAEGFAHFDGSPGSLDGAGCAIRPTVRLGDGWWWVE
ncbi:hypothetical protein [Amycolatopsis silviterrae]|uniref:Uncharacterized protein n=1 Tax=Amycolatopsis silviterrae TaxID=1656914 RepID=A0ABW5HBQ5_9PSEU